jgi:hypothetical protein
MVVTVEDENSYKVPTVDNVRVTYLQEADCVSDKDEPQILRIYTENNGIARFIVLETERWAIDDIENLVEILNDFKTRAGIK